MTKTNSGQEIEVKPQIHNVKQQNPYQAQNQHAMHFQQNQYNPGTSSGANWNQNWNQQQGQAAALVNINAAQIAPNQGSWNQYAQPLPSGINQQQWGYNASQPIPYVNNASTPNVQSNWNYNYYGQPQQQGYYPADSAGTGTYNF